MNTLFYVPPVFGATTEPTFDEIAEYYDNRKAVVTVTGDDWGWYSAINPYFDDFCEMLTSKNIYFTTGIVTNISPDWPQIQGWLDQDFLEAASHSRTHPYLPYGDYDDYFSEIAGSKQDIIGNLTLPHDYTNGGSEYVYVWLEPYGQSDPLSRQILGEQKYLVDRLVGYSDSWATWNSTDELFDRVGYSIRMEEQSAAHEPDRITNVTILNAKFDEVYNEGGIYHIFTHPRNLNYAEGRYVDLHTDYISNRNDVWYVSFGHLYLYHWIDIQNVVSVSSTAEANEFHINIGSTDRQEYGAKYPVTYVFDVPADWTDVNVNYRFRQTDPWAPMTSKTSSDFFNGIDAFRLDSENHKIYVSIGFEDTNDIYLKLLDGSDILEADFSALPTSGFEPLTVSFTDQSTSSEEIVSWDWDFGDGNTSTEQNPTHVYYEGTYDVTLTVEDSEGDDDTETKNDYITVTIQEYEEFFSDGFESNDFSKWTSTGGTPTVIASPVHCGSYAMQSDITGDYARKRLTTDPNLSHHRLYVYFTDLPDSNGEDIRFMRITNNPSGSYIFTLGIIYRSTSGKVDWYISTREASTEATTYYTPSTALQTGRWYCVEVMCDMSSSDGTTDGNYELWIDGSSIIKRNNKDTDYTNIGYLYVGSINNDESKNVYIDCVVAANSYIGPHEAVSTEDTYLVVRGSDNGIYYRPYSSGEGTWGNWIALPGYTCDSPAAIIYEEQLYMIVRGMDGNSLWFGSLDLSDDSFSGWSYLSGVTPSKPTLVSYGDKMILVVRGSDNRIYHRQYNLVTESWGSWNAVPTGTTVDSPAAAIDGDYLHLVVRGMDDGLYHQKINLPTLDYLGWSTISGTTPSAPTLTSNYKSGGDDHLLYLIVRGSNDGIYLRSFDGSWNGWTSLPGKTNSPVGACIQPSLPDPNAALHIVAKGMTGGLYHGKLDLNSETFLGWTWISGDAPSPPTLTS
jgi:PKD repeat protein